MKLFRAALALAGILLAAPAFAQNMLDSLQMARADIDADRKTIITTTMQFTEKESAAFWPIYDTYRVSAHKINDKMVSLVQRADSSLAALDAKTAESLTTQWMDLKAEKDALKKSYVVKFGKVLPPKKLVRYYQIENKMDAIIEYSLAANVPLVR
jgi:hypothetical protein